MKTIYSDAVKHFGQDHQLLKCVEEMAELQQAIIKHHLSINDKTRLSVNLIEEIVDVEIMLNQIKTIFNSEVDIQVYNHYKKKKLEKLQKLIS